MCKEDIRIARKAVPKQIVHIAGVASPIKLLNANANRYSLTAFLPVSAPGDSTDSACVAAKIGDQYMPLIAGGGPPGGGHIDLVKVGQAITYEIWFICQSNLTSWDIYCGETELEQTLERI